MKFSGYLVGMGLWPVAHFTLDTSRGTLYARTCVSGLWVIACDAALSEGRKV